MTSGKLAAVAPMEVPAMKRVRNDEDHQDDKGQAAQDVDQPAENALKRGGGGDAAGLGDGEQHPMGRPST